MRGCEIYIWELRGTITEGEMEVKSIDLRDIEILVNNLKASRLMSLISQNKYRKGYFSIVLILCFW